MGAQGTTIAVDPAARGFAWARYVDGVLRACGNIPTEDLQRDLRDVGAYWIIETPQNYSTFGVAHQDLDRLRATTKEIEAWARANGGDVEYVKPFSWKGNVPKQIQHRRIFEVLSPEERVIAGPTSGPKYDHNTYDAIALGLWASRRVGRGGSTRTGAR